MFRTELSLRPAAQLLSQGARVLTIGSCFSDVIGERLGQHKVRTLTNPFGTVFNPLAAARLLRAVAGEDTDWQQHLVQARGRWQSFDLHATVGADSPPALLTRIEETVREAADFARTADVLVWTLGTAYAYRLRDTGEVVNNCHKVPADRFEKELLTAEEIVSAVTEAYALLRQRNPKLQLVLTVSPVRHLKDTLPLNAVSKSVLRVACHYLSELLPGASYFPAYELLLDDLRDYRFYGADMLHPSEVAEQYIWEKFTSVYFESGFKQFVQEWGGIRRALNHRPIFNGAPEHREFLEQTRQRLERLAGRVDVRAELRDVEQRLAALPIPPAPATADEPDDNEERIDVGYEDATVAPTARAEAPVAPAPPVREPSWAEILAAETEAADDDDEDELDEDAGPVNEAEAALPSEAEKKRRKRKRGGRKHKKKNRSGEEVTEPSLVAEASATDAPAVATESLAFAESTAETESYEETAVITDAPLAGSQELSAEEPRRTSASKRRNRGGRKKPALYADQSTASADLAAPAHAETTSTDESPETVSVQTGVAERDQRSVTAAESNDASVVSPEVTPEAEVAASLSNAAEAALAAEVATEDVRIGAAVTIDAPVGLEPPTPAPDGANSATSIEPAKLKSRRTSRAGKGGNRVAPALEAAAEALPHVLASPAPEAAAVAPTPPIPASSTPQVESKTEVPTAPASSESKPTATKNQTQVALKKRAAPRRKPKAAAGDAPAAETTGEPASAPSVAPTLTEGAPAAGTTPAEQAAPSAPPKRRARPPRRKPEDPAE